MWLRRSGNRKLWLVPLITTQRRLKWSSIKKGKSLSIIIIIVKSIWGDNFIDWSHLDSLWASRSILLMWDKRVVEKLEDAVRLLGIILLHVDFKVWMMILNDFFFGVYGTIANAKRRRLWTELAGIQSWWRVLWHIRGILT